MQFLFCLFWHLRLGIKCSIVLIPLLGITWVFGVLAFDQATVVFLYLFAILNSLQVCLFQIFWYRLLFLTTRFHQALSMKHRFYWPLIQIIGLFQFNSFFYFPCRAFLYLFFTVYLINRFVTLYLGLHSRTFSLVKVEATLLFQFSFRSVLGRNI